MAAYSPVRLRRKSAVGNHYCPDFASVGAPALPRRPASFAERTDWLGPDPARCYAASIAQSTRLLLSSDLVAYCGSLVA